MSSFSSETMELTSLKLTFDGEIRRLSVARNTLTYDELVNKTMCLFPHLDHVQFSWVDDENDKVMIDSDEELSEALRVMTLEKKGYLRFEVNPKTENVDYSFSNNSVPQFGTIVHEGVKCNVCGCDPIAGPRFKCTVQADYDMCAECEQKHQHLYPVVKINDPSQAPFSIITVIDEQKRRCKGPRKHRGIVCDECNSRNFTGYRFQCTVRPNFDLCSNCEAKRVQPYAMIKHYRPNMLKSIEVIANDSVSGDKRIEQDVSKERHCNIRCNCCGMKPIVGIRYKCSVRPDFNLCGLCESKTPKQPHPLLKMITPEKSLVKANLLDHMQVGLSNGMGWLRGVAPSNLPRNVKSDEGRSEATKSQQENSDLEQSMMDQCKEMSFAEDNDDGECKLDRSSTSSFGTSSHYSSVSSSTSTGSGRSLEQVLTQFGNGKNASSKETWKPKLMARFVHDVTMPDGSTVAPCTIFHKSWKVRNDGATDWPEGCHLVTVGGDNLVDISKPFKHVVEKNGAGGEIDITVQLIAPNSTGRYVGYFRLEDPLGNLFGQRLWCDIRVTEDDTNISFQQWQVVEPVNESDDNVMKGKDVSEDEDVEDTEARPTSSCILSSGCTVNLHSLEHRPELNNLLGTCLRWDENTGRWEVELLESQRSVMIRPSNLRICGVDNTLEILNDQQCLQETIHEKEEQQIHTDCVLDGKNEEDAPTASEDEQQNDELFRWNAELNVLKEMGFYDVDVLLPLLNAHITTPASERIGENNTNSVQKQSEGLQAVVWSLLSGQ